jgi:hypothetical protein
MEDQKIYDINGKKAVVIEGRIFIEADPMEDLSPDACAARMLENGFTSQYTGSKKKRISRSKTLRRQMTDSPKSTKDDEGWTVEKEQALVMMYNKGIAPKEIAKKLFSGAGKEQKIYNKIAQLKKRGTILDEKSESDPEIIEKETEVGDNDGYHTFN